jgi:hypothetical protein
MSRGLVAVACGDTARWSPFAPALYDVRIPDGSVVRWYMATLVQAGRSQAVVEMLAHGFEWVWFVDDDNLPYPDTLERLLAHDVDVVSPLVMSRHDMTMPSCYLDDQDTQAPLSLPARLHPMASVSMGGALIRRRVFEALEPPWFTFRYDGLKITGEVNICQRIREAGFRIYCDFATPMRHVFPAVVEPVVGPGCARVSVEVAGRTVWVPGK